MALSSSLYTGTSGLINMGNVMQVVSNNLANSSTVGFKKGVSSFADTLSQTVATQSGIGQLGRGMSIGEVAQNFEQGSFESTGNVTDVSIGGDGFFIVSEPGEDNTYYTRAGNFHFDESGQLVNPNGYVVQGWELDSDTGDDVGAITDIIMDSFTSPPKESTSLTAITNLDADAVSQSDVMANFWDASETEAYIAGERYEYQTVVKVYDSLGSAHDVSIYYDKKTGTEWEYMITCEPEEDKRELIQGTTSEGLLARGTITFSQSSGDIIDISMEELTGRVGNIVASGVNDEEDIHFTVEDSESMLDDGYGFTLEYDGTNWVLTNPIFDENGENIENEVIDVSTTSTRTITPGADSITDDLGDYAFQWDGATWNLGVGSPALGGGGIITNTNTALEFELASGTVIQYDFGAAVAANDTVTFTVDSDSAVKNYPDATVHYSDSQNIYLRLDNRDEEVDLKLYLDKPSDTGDTISFDINAESDLHVQGIEGSNFIGETDNGNTNIEVNDPSVMTIDETGVNIVWYPDDATWRWGNPEVAAQNGDLIPEITYSGDAAFSPTPVVVTPSPANPGDASAMSKYVKDIQLQFDGTDWDWDMPFKETGEDIINEDLNLGTVDAVRSITTGTTAGVFGDLGDYTFDYDAAVPGWVPDAANPGGVITTNTADVLELQLASGTVIRYEFDSSVADADSISFTVDPSSPDEYPNASLTAGTTDVIIDFNSDGNDDLEISLATAAAAPVATDTFLFTVDPDSPPEEYPDATLVGDQNRAVVDLDGSGNEDDSDDIVFSFTNPLDVTGTENISLIEFDISGSTAWSTVQKDSITDTGYFSFKTDFLGGDNGATENEIKLDIGAKYDGTNFENDSMSSTQYAKPSSTVFQNSDGYAAGDFEGVDIAVDGTITGIYSNGELIPLFRIGLARFLNNNGLYTEGGNLFSETRDSGDAITNRPGENGLGTISPSSLELSNVDISEEFVDMITTQRGFQANSKTVTTVDDMMNTVIQMKR